jgi:hypothetical protein
MNKQKSIYLYLKGKKAWNIWAIRLLRRKQTLIKMGKWDITTEFDFEKNCYNTRGLNEVTQAWLDRAFVDFSKIEFAGGDTCSNKAKARRRLDEKYIQEGKIPVEGINIDFRGFIFPADVRFDQTIFNGIALFNQADFHGTAWFSDAKFKEAAKFEDVLFRAYAGFHQTEFGSFATFENSKFYKSSNFEAITAAKTFALNCTKFINEVPSFKDADFKQTPRITDLKVLPAPEKSVFSPRIRNSVKHSTKDSRRRRTFFLRDLVWTEWAMNRIKHSIKQTINSRRNRDDELNFRSLRHLAREAGDQQRERAFYAGEMRSRRHLKDRLKDLPAGFLRYCYGAAYELTSNFGRSLTRPVICWVALFYGFSYIYLASSPALMSGKCQNEESMTTLQAAQTISLNNALFFIHEGYSDKVGQAHGCLNNYVQIEHKYFRKPKAVSKDQSRLHSLNDDDEIYTASIDNASNKTHEKSNITFIAVLQLFLQFSMIAMFILGVRNHLKMK